MNENHHHALQDVVICELCGAVKGSSSSYKAHASKVHGIAAFKCSHCDNAFHNKHSLKEHNLRFMNQRYSNVKSVKQYLCHKLV